DHGCSWEAQLTGPVPEPYLCRRCREVQGSRTARVRVLQSADRVITNRRCGLPLDCRATLGHPGGAAAFGGDFGAAGPSEGRRGIARERDRRSKGGPMAPVQAMTGHCAVLRENSKRLRPPASMPITTKNGECPMGAKAAGRIILPGCSCDGRRGVSAFVIIAVAPNRARVAEGTQPRCW